MVRIVVIVLAVLVAFSADGLAQRHVSELMQMMHGESEFRALQAYEKGEPLNGIHSAAEAILGGLLLVAICSLWRFAARLGILQIFWGMGLVAVCALCGTGALFEMIRDGAESQLGLQVPFFASSRPSVLMDSAVAISAVGLLLVGPPRGWSGTEDIIG
ncbi:MAG: hypothetical protein KDD69_10415 [Bdellovibrionales bacterium]|nr:hypothetical protein [Bdellovibrionales bacterium]